MGNTLKVILFVLVLLQLGMTQDLEVTSVMEGDTVGKNNSLDILNVDTTILNDTSKEKPDFLVLGAEFRGSKLETNPHLLGGAIHLHVYPFPNSSLGLRYSISAGEKHVEAPLLLMALPLYFRDIKKHHESAISPSEDDEEDEPSYVVQMLGPLFVGLTVGAFETVLYKFQVNNSLSIVPHVSVCRIAYFYDESTKIWHQKYYGALGLSLKSKLRNRKMQVLLSGELSKVYEEDSELGGRYGVGIEYSF